eukprot:SAG11_NODE_1822_length_4207_cov_1.736125_8_plen_70_part_00
MGIILPLLAVLGAATMPLASNADVGVLSMAEVEWRVPVGCDFSGFFTEVVAVRAARPRPDAAAGLPPPL